MFNMLRILVFCVVITTAWRDFEWGSGEGSGYHYDFLPFDHDEYAKLPELVPCLPCICIKETLYYDSVGKIVSTCGPSITGTVIHEIPANFTLSIADMDLSGQVLSRLQSKVFQIAHLLSLESLKMKKCSIANIHEDAFDGMWKLKSLDLDVNNLTVLHKDTFQGITNIEYLYLMNNHITELPLGLFDNLHKLERLYLEYNNISYLHPHIFWDLKALKSLHLNNNKIQKIAYGVFEKIPCHFDLHLEYNSIEEIEPFAFGGIKKPNDKEKFRLYLSNNKIRKLKEYIFENVTTLTFLDLKNNYLDTIEKDTFQNCSRLLDLNLSRNKIKYIFEDFKAINPNILINLNSNPFVCDCRNERFLTQVRTLHKVPRANYECSAPANQRGKSLFSIDPNLLVCKPEILKTTTFIKDKQVNFGCKVVGDPKPDIKWESKSGDSTFSNNFAGDMTSLQVDNYTYWFNLTISHSITSDIKYMCMVSNDLGEDSRNLSMTLKQFRVLMKEDLHGSGNAHVAWMSCGIVILVLVLILAAWYIRKYTSFSYRNLLQN